MSPKLDDTVRNSMKEIFGYTDEEIETIENSPNQVDVIKNWSVLTAKKLVATCVEEHGCDYNEVGDRYGL
jgi:hypothetical protein